MFEPWDKCLDASGVATLRCIPIVFKNVIAAALMFVGIVALFFIMYAGLSMVTSGGDAKKVEGARKIMTFAVLGLVIVLLSFAILYFIGYITNTTGCITGFTDIKTFLTGCQ